MPMFGVVANKVDLYYEEKVKEEEGEKFAKSIGAKFLLTSAKNDPNGFINYLEDLFDDYLVKNNNETTRLESVMINRVPKKKPNCC